MGVADDGARRGRLLGNALWNGPIEVASELTV